MNISRRHFISLGSIAGISVMIGRLPIASATELVGTETQNSWIGTDGKAKSRWDAMRKVTGQKVFARDYRAQDLPGWPTTQAHAFMLKVTRADCPFEGIDLSSLDAVGLQPDRVVLQEDLVRDGLNTPQDTEFGPGFYGKDLLLAPGTTPPLLGHPVAILIYTDFARFQSARRQSRFNDTMIIYGKETGYRPPANYGAARFVRVGGESPLSPSVFSPHDQAAIKGAFRGNEVIWPPNLAQDGLHIPALSPKDRGDGLIQTLRAAETNPGSQSAGMQAVADIDAQIIAARDDDKKIVLDRRVSSQSIDPCAMEPDNCNAWFDQASRTLHVLSATQSPAGVVNSAATLARNTRFEVENIVLLTGSTVGYGSKDYSVFPFYAMVAAFYSDGLPVRMANDRYEQFQIGMKRHAVDMDVTLVCDRQSGLFDVLRGQYSCNGGGRENLSVAVSHVAAHGAQSAYYFPMSDLTALAMATPAVEAGSMRGFGALQSSLATELMVDELANELKIDPIALRQRNAMRPGYHNTQGGIVSGDPRIVEMLERAASHPIWTERESRKAAFERDNPGRLHGTGFAQVQKKYGAGGDPSILTLAFDEHGKLIMRHCVQEIGTGGTTAQQILVSEMLGKVPDEVEFGVTAFAQLPLHSGSTDGRSHDEMGLQDPFWTPSVTPDMSSSNGAYYIGFATRQAAQFLLEHSLIPAALAIWGQETTGLNVTPAQIAMGPSGLSGGGMAPLSFARLAAQAHRMGLITGIGVHSYSLWQWARASFEIPTVGLCELPLDAISVCYGSGADPELRARMTTGGYDYIKRQKVSYPSTARSNGGPSTYAPAACLVEVAVNSFTGQTELLAQHMLIDPGGIIVPQLVSGQVQGGTAMGIGHALFEELPLLEDGPGNGTWNFNRYRLPRASDIAVWKQTIEYLTPHSPNSPPKGMAEVVMFPIVSAIANAIAHATGKRFYDFPITPDKVLKAIGQ